MSGEERAHLPLVSLADVAEAGLWQRIGDGIRLWFQMMI